MDISKIMKTLLSNDAITGISEKTGASEEDIKKVLAQALPGMITGAQQQAENESSGFAQALNDHAAANTANIGSFLQNVDLGDGAKIIGHLLGAKESTATAKEIAKATGVKQSLVSQIMSAAAPLLMSLLGQQTSAQNSSASASSGSGNTNSGANALGGLMGSLLGNVDVASLAMNLLGSGSSSSSSSSKPASTAKKKKKTTASTSTSGKKPASSSTGKKPASSSSGKKPASSTSGKKKTTTSSTSTGKKKTTAATSSSAKKKTSKKDEKKEDGLLDSAVSFITGLLK